MSIEKKILDSLKKAYENAGTQKELEQKTGIAQALIGKFLNKQRDTGNMRVSTLSKLFPEMEITFFRNERKAVTSDLSPMAKRVISQLNNLDDESQLDALTYISELKGRAAAKHVKSSRGAA